MKKYLVIVLLVVMASLAFGHPKEPQRDLRDELIQPADNVYRTYGYSNETLALYNIWANQAAAKNYEIRIKKLEEQIAELVKQMAELTEKIKPDDEVQSAPADSDTAGVAPVVPNEGTKEDSEK